MHHESHEAMAAFVRQYVPEAVRVADIGSYDVNGTFRDLFEHCSYTGLDIAEGPGVDRLITLADWGTETYDVVISGSTIEHVADMAQWARNAISITKPGGLLCIIAPHGLSGWEEHFHPLDCWRIWPDGMRWLFQETEILDCRNDDKDVVLIARRPLTVAETSSYDEEAPGDESDEQVVLRLNGFAAKVHALVESETLKSGCGGALVGYGLGLIMAQGASEADLRQHCDNVIRGLVDGYAAIQAHEKKTFS